MIPTMLLPPTTNCPKVSMIAPAPARPSAAPSRMRRVEATLRPSRNSVETSSSAGNTEKSSGRRTYTAVSRMTTASEMLIESSTSRSSGGSGKIISAKIATTPISIGASRSTPPQPACLDPGSDDIRPLPWCPGAWCQGRSGRPRAPPR